MGLHGAVRKAVMEKQLRAELAEYGLPMSEYVAQWDTYFEHDPELLMMVTFIHRERCCGIEISDIYSNDAGEVTQRAAPMLY